MKKLALYISLAYCLWNFAAVASVTTDLLDLRAARTADVTPGVWHSDLNKARAYAEANGLPLVAVWSNGDECAHCVVFENCIMSPAFRNWMRDSGIVFYFGVRNDAYDGQEGYHGSSFYWCCNWQNASMAWPYVRVWWPEGDVDECHSGSWYDGEDLGRPIRCSYNDGRTDLANYIFPGDYGTYNPGGRRIISVLVGNETASTAMPVGGSAAGGLLAKKVVEAVGDYDWSFRPKDNYVVIYGGRAVAAVSPRPVGSVEIPAVLGGKTVQGIGNWAFTECFELTGVTIPAGVTSIGDWAFNECLGLTSVTIPAGVTSIGDWAFNECIGLTSVTIPAGVMSIGDWAFNECFSLANVSLPAGVTSIGDWAFNECIGLTSVAIPAGVTSIGDWAFNECIGLTSVTIPDSVTDIGFSAFAGCSGLTNVTLPGSLLKDVSYVGALSQNGWTLLSTSSDGTREYREYRSATIGHSASTTMSLTLVGPVELAFSWKVSSEGGWDYLRWYLDGTEQAGISGTDGTWQNMVVSVPTGEHTIEWTYSKDSIISRGSDCGWVRIFRAGESVASLFPDSYTTLRSVTLTGTTAKIPDHALEGCAALTAIEIPSTVTNIGDSAFYGCNSLSNIVFTGNAPIVGSDAFLSVASGCTVYVPWSSTGWGVGIPGIWNGLYIRYADSRVTFDLGGHGSRIGGGELEQTVTYRTAAIAPDVMANEGWEFLGWDADFSCVIWDMTVNALWRRVYAAGEALGADTASALLPWSVGTNGVASVTGYDDSTAMGGKSVTFMAVDDATAWVEVVVTNACRVSFDWKCSCEPLVKGRPYDFLAFSVDSVRQGFICGETGWTSVTNYVTGEGEHVLRWTFLRDEDGSAGEDCSWLANVKVAPSVTLSFARGGATAGSVPEPMTAYTDESIVLPGQGTLAWPKHTFLGWYDGATLHDPGDPYPCGGALLLTAQWAANTLSAPVITAPSTYEAASATVTITADAGASVYYTLDGSTPDPARPESVPYLGPFEVVGSATIRAVSVRDDYFDSDVASATVTRLPWTSGECLNWPEQEFTTGGDAEWTRVKGVSADGYALRSGVITHSQTSRLETVVSGPGTITFSCKVAGEIVKKIVYDGLAFCIDGAQQGDLIGNADWEIKTFEVTGNGMHTLSWLYVKDEDGTVGEDCAWLDSVTWTPSGVTVDVGDGKSVTVPGTWLNTIAGRIAAAGGDATAALSTLAANGRMPVVWCYVLGLDPESPTNDFKIVSFPVKADGTPDLANIVFDPIPDKWNIPAARPVLKGATVLDGPWTDVDGKDSSSFKFFKVEVRLP